jgi:hypothetical protein
VILGADYHAAAADLPAELIVREIDEKKNREEEPRRRTRR